jgi:predicted ribosomally synthesized peptide with SipW-like signal peptide
MKKIILSVGSILFAAAIVVGGTGAFLSDNESSTGNTFATGVIDLKIDNESYITNSLGALVFSSTTSWSLSGLAGKLFFNFLDIKPGDIGEDTISLHVNNNNAWACMNIQKTATPENGQNDPEAAVDTTVGVNDGELQNYLYFTFWADDGDNVFESGEQVFKQGLAKDIFNGQNWVLADASKNIWGGSGPLTGDTVKYIGKAWCFGAMAQTPKAQDNLGKTGSNGPLVRGTGFSCAGADVGNAVQSDGLKVDVSFAVVQSRGNASYLCSGVVLGTSTPPTSTSTLFSDNFNASCQKGKEFNKIDNSKWDQKGGVEGDDHGNPHGKVAYFDAGTNNTPPNHTESLTTMAINTVGYHDITLSYDRNIDRPVGTSATLTVDYSVNGGSSWTTLETVTVDSDWTTKTWSLSPSADNKASVKVRFTFVGTNNTDHAYIDNVSITGVTP